MSRKKYTIMLIITIFAPAMFNSWKYFSILFLVSFLLLMMESLMHFADGFIKEIVLVILITCLAYSRSLRS